MRQATTAQLTGLLRTRDDLELDGWRRASIDAALTAGVLHRLRRGWYLSGDDWKDLWPESRHRAHVIAAAADASIAPVFCLTSAAVLHRLPLHRVAVDRVHTIVGESARRSAPGFVRHRSQIDPADIVAVDGILCTSPERTILDLARLASPEVAVVSADAWMTRICGHPRDYDEAAGEAWRESMLERAHMPGARGVRNARAVLSIADGRSELPLESVTKLQLHRLGFRPHLQVPVSAPAGRTYWMDMQLSEGGAFVECDGEGKYTDAALRDGWDIERVVLDEKRREDWVRGVTGRPVLRVGSADVRSPRLLADRLTRFGVTMPSRRERLQLPSAPLLAGQ